MADLARDLGGAPVRVALVDDHAMFTGALARLLAVEDGIEVAGTASTVADGVALAVDAEVDVALVDFHLPDGDGVTAAAEIKRRRSATKVVMLTGSADDRVLVQAIEAGCSGFLTKERAVGEVVAAVRAAAAGEVVVTPQQLAHLLPRLRRTASTPPWQLTEREVEVLRLVAAGLPNKAIARELHLSTNTVRNYVQAILRRLDAHSKLEAVATAVRVGLIDYPR